MPFMSRGDTIPFSWRRRISLCANVLVWYIVHIMCSLSFRLPVVDLFFLGSSSGIDKGRLQHDFGRLPLELMILLISLTWQFVLKTRFCLMD